MPRTISTTSFARFVSGAALAAAAVLGAVGLRDQRADACGWSAPTVEELTTFDPLVAADRAPAGLQFDPYVAGYGGACDDCGRDAMLADWNGYLGGAVPRADWEKVLFSASIDELGRIGARMTPRTRGGPAAGALAPLPYGIDVGGWKLSAKATIQSGLDYVKLARRAERVASYDSGAVTPAELSALLADARAGLKAAKAPFLAQRYAFQVVRVLFYQRDWAALITFFDKNSARLEKPSADLAWRARYYVAGALRRSGNRARANLELARIHAGSPALAGAAAQDFQPMEDADWKEALRLARGAREQAQLWRLVGVTQDGLTAAQEIVKIDPTSDLLGLLVTRELARAETSGVDLWAGSVDPTRLAAQQKAYAALEAVATKIAGSKGADRPWLMRLVIGHLAARRGDLATARVQLQAAVTARPGDVRVASQAKASLALALVIEGKLDAAREDEIARTMTAIDPGFSRLGPVTLDVRGRLAAAYAKAGRIVDAEFLRNGTVDPIDPATGKPVSPVSKWADLGFLREMIARAGKDKTAFDRFVLAGTYSRPQLELELAMRQVMTGDFAGGSKTLAGSPAASTSLGTDPFVTHVVDCHDCDHAQYGSAPWTHASFVARLAALSRQAAGKGDAAAQAALDLGTGLYNMTWYGNARIVLEGTHQATSDTKLAERWYKRAFDLAASRELKARAAFYAAKAELHGLITAAGFSPYDNVDVLPVPTTWYPIVKTFADTAYYREILAECGAFRRWATPARPGRH